MMEAKKEKTLKELTEELTLRDEMLHENEKLFRSIFCLNPIPMCLTDEEGKYVQINRAFVEVAQVSEEEIIGKLAVDSYEKPEDRQLVLEILSTVGYVKNKPITFVKPNGCKIECSFSAKSVMYKSKPHIIAVIVVKEEICV